MQNFAMGSSHSAIFPSKERKRSIDDVCNSCPHNTHQRGVDLSLGACGPGAFSTVIQEFGCL